MEKETKKYPTDKVVELLPESYQQLVQEIEERAEKQKKEYEESKKEGK